MDTINILKARAYDILAQIDQLQRQLQAINQQIATLSQMPQPTQEIQTEEGA